MVNKMLGKHLFRLLRRAGSPALRGRLLEMMVSAGVPRKLLAQWAPTAAQQQQAQQRKRTGSDDEGRTTPPPKRLARDEASRDPRMLANKENIKDPRLLNAKDPRAPAPRSPPLPPPPPQTQAPPPPPPPSEKPRSPRMEGVKPKSPTPERDSKAEGAKATTDAAKEPKSEVSLNFLKSLLPSATPPPVEEPGKDEPSARVATTPSKQRVPPSSKRDALSPKEKVMHDRLSHEAVVRLVMDTIANVADDLPEEQLTALRSLSNEVPEMRAYLAKLLSDIPAAVAAKGALQEATSSPASPTNSPQRPASESTELLIDCIAKDVDLRKFLNNLGTKTTENAPTSSTSTENSERKVSLDGFGATDTDMRLPAADVDLRVTLAGRRPSTDVDSRRDSPLAVTPFGTGSSKDPRRNPTPDPTDLPSQDPRRRNDNSRPNDPRNADEFRRDDPRNRQENFRRDDLRRDSPNQLDDPRLASATRVNDPRSSGLGDDPRGSKPPRASRWQRDEEPHQRMEPKEQRPSMFERVDPRVRLSEPARELTSSNRLDPRIMSDPDSRSQPFSLDVPENGRTFREMDLRNNPPYPPFDGQQDNPPFNRPPFGNTQNNGPAFGNNQNNGPNFRNNGPISGMDGPNFRSNGPNFNNDGSNFGNNGRNFNNDGPNFGNNGRNFSNDVPTLRNNGPNFENNGPDFRNGRNFGINGQNFGNNCQNFGNNQINGPFGNNFNGPQFGNRNNFMNNSNDLRANQGPNPMDARFGLGVQNNVMGVGGLLNGPNRASLLGPSPMGPLQGRLGAPLLGQNLPGAALLGGDSLLGRCPPVSLIGAPIAPQIPPLMGQPAFLIGQPWLMRGNML